MKLNFTAKTLSCALIPFSLFAGLANAAISVYPIGLSTNAQGSAQVKVTSSSENTEFVKITIKAIDNPATPQEVERDVVAGENLVVTPGKFALNAGSTRTIRMVSMDLPEKEKAYRVKFEAVPNIDDDEESLAAGKGKASVGLNMSWGVLVMVPPANPHEEISYTPATHTLYNKGNIHISLRQIGICKTRDSDKGCKWTDVKQAVYPDQSYDLSSALNTMSAKDIVHIKYMSHVSQSIVEKML